MIQENQKNIIADNVVFNADPPAIYDKLQNKIKTNSLFNWKKKRMEKNLELFQKLITT